MNLYEARAHFDGASWIGMFKRVNRIDFEAVQSDGKVSRYQSALEAENAAHRAILAIINGDIEAWNNCPKTPLEKAERAFDSIFVNGKQIPVVVK